MNTRRWQVPVPRRSDVSGKSSGLWIIKSRRPSHSQREQWRGGARCCAGRYLPTYGDGFAGALHPVPVLSRLHPKILCDSTDRGFYPSVRCRVSGVFCVHFSPVLPAVVPAPESHGGVSLPLVRSLRSGFLHFPFRRSLRYITGEHIPTGRSFDWIDPSMNCL